MNPLLLSYIRKNCKTPLKQSLGVEYRLVQKSGSWYSYGETRIGQGRDAARQFLKDNPDVADEIEVKIREALGMLPGAEAPPTTDEAAGESAKGATKKGS